VKIGSLFSGIGGLELGLERAGCGHTVWQCEIDPYARAVLAKHWPDAIRFDDITKMTDVPPVDLICGGFPCQDISNAGRREGITGARSGLFYELMRVVRLVRPRFVVLENVAALLGRGMGDVLGELSESGYDAEWSTVSACAVGAPHTRNRVFVIANAMCKRLAASMLEAGRTNGDNREEASTGLWGRLRKSTGFTSSGLSSCREAENAARAWVDAEIEPLILGGSYGVPSRVDRLKCLGNAVVPQVAEVVGRRVMELMT
jgi:DNA (cytosine-5)-methyltransferase 1